MPRKNARSTYTDERGKFSKGNPGRPRGSRHKVTRASDDLLNGQSEAIIQKAIDLALAGDKIALRLCLERISPPRKDAAVQFDLPKINCAKEAAGAAQAVLLAVSCADITPLEGAAVMALVEQYRRTLELCELEERIQTLERATKG